MRACDNGARPSIDANAGRDFVELELVVVEEGVGMAEQNVGNTGSIAMATSRPTI